MKYEINVILKDGTKTVAVDTMSNGSRSDAKRFLEK